MLSGYYEEKNEGFLIEPSGSVKPVTPNLKNKFKSEARFEAKLVETKNGSQWEVVDFSPPREEEKELIIPVEVKTLHAMGKKKFLLEKLRKQFPQYAGTVWFR